MGYEVSYLYTLGNLFMAILCGVFIIVAPRLLDQTFRNLFAGQFSIKRSECNRKRLQQAHGVFVVHRKGIPLHSPKLHHNVVQIVVMHNLKVFDRCLCYSSVEIKHKRLGFYLKGWTHISLIQITATFTFIPLWALIVKHK